MLQKVAMEIIVLVRYIPILRIKIGMKFVFKENFLKGEAITQHLFITKSNHSFTLFYFRLYIFGGYDIREGQLDNLWMVDMLKLPTNLKNEFSETENI